MSPVKDIGSQRLRARESRTSLCIGVFLAAVTLAVYWPVTGHPFINYDDTVYVSENPTVQQGLTWRAVAWAFTNIEAAFWHPLTWLSHMLDWQLHGANAGGHHLTSLLLHVANTLLLFGVLRRMTGAVWRSGFVAALFALHPLRVESVAWVAERKDVLSGFFFLLTLWAYVRATEANAKLKVQKSSEVQEANRRTERRRFGVFGLGIGGSAGFWALSLLFFALGLMSKPMLVTLPFLLLLLDCWPLGRLEFGQGGRTPNRGLLRRLLLEKIPFFALAAVACVLVYLTEKKAGAVRTLDEIPFGLRLANAVTSYVDYLRKLVWPDDLAVFYPFPNSVPLGRVALAVLLLGVISAAAVWALRRRPYFTVGWFWYLGTLVPVIGLVPVGIHAMADRFTYIPLIGVFILMAWGVAGLMPAGPLRRALLVFGAVVALAGCAGATRRQLRHWESDARLFEHALAVTRNNVVAHCHLAMALMEQGREADAARQYAAALRINPAFDDVNYNLGNFHRRQGRLDEAAAYYRAELRLRPRHTQARNNLGVVLAMQKKTDGAIQCFKAVLEARPDSADAHNNLANLLVETGRPEEALSHYLAALRWQPDHPDAHRNLARLHERQERPADAARHFAAVARLKPDDLEAHECLGRLLALQGRMNEAAAHEQTAGRIRRELAAACNRRGILLAQQGRTDEAVAEFTRALRDGGDPAETHKNLALARSLQTNAAEAVVHYRAALRARPDFPEVLNNLAWMLATHGDAGVRDGAEAVRLAERAAQLTNRRDAPTLDTLAAAYAETGRFEDAIQSAQDAVTAALAGGQTGLAAQIRGRIQLYQSQRPVRD